MSAATYLVQECPICGRRLQVRVEHLGKQVVCHHCAAKFKAHDTSSGGDPPAESSLALLARAEKLIDSVSRTSPRLDAEICEWQVVNRDSEPK